MKRLDGPVKVTGAAKYTYDINRPGQLHGRILRSPHPHARVVSIDLTAAQKAPGVKAAMNVIEPGKEVMYQGDEVAAVAAATEDQARDALRLIKVQYEVLPQHRHRRAGDAGRRAEDLQGRQHRGRRGAGEPAISTPASRRPRTSSRPATRRRC